MLEKKKIKRKIKKEEKEDGSQNSILSNGKTGITEGAKSCIAEKGKKEEEKM